MALSLKRVSVVGCMAEFSAMALFVVFGCGSAMGIRGSLMGMVQPGWVVLVSLVFGLTITALAYTFGHHSGAHINCAVTFGLVLAGACEPLQGLAHFAAQMLGSVAGAGILCAMYPKAMDRTGGLGANSVGAGWGAHNALVGEVMGTFLLMTVVLQTAVNVKSTSNRAQAPFAIGLAVFIAHTVLIPIDGCSINPTRSFGPALVNAIRYAPDESPFKDMWIFWVGPLLGAALAVGHYKALEKMAPESTAAPEDAYKVPENTREAKAEA